MFGALSVGAYLLYKHTRSAATKAQATVVNGIMAPCTGDIKWGGGFSEAARLRAPCSITGVPDARDCPSGYTYSNETCNFSSAPGVVY